MASVTKLEIETRRLQSDVDSLSSHLSALSQTGREMLAGVQSLSAMWEGEAKEAFTLQFRKDYNILLEVEKILQGLVEDLEYARGRYDTCESNVGGIVSAIKV